MLRPTGRQLQDQYSPLRPPRPLGNIRFGRDGDAPRWCVLATRVESRIWFQLRVRLDNQFWEDLRC